MKKNIISLLSLLYIFSLSIVFSSCKKDDDDDDNPTNTPTPSTDGMLEFHIHTMIDTSEVDSGDVAIDVDGRQIQLNDARFYISGIQVQKSDGSWLALPGAIVMKTMDEEEYQVGNIPAGNYITIAFDIGLDASTNSTNPSQYAAGSVLAENDMYFNSTLGYKFLNIEGLVDTSATQTGPVDFPISYQLGTSAQLVHVQMPDLPFTMLANDHAFAHLWADYGALLEGIDFKTQGSGDPLSNPTVTQQIANNIPQFIIYED